MKVLVVSQREVAALLPMAECMAAMADVLRAVARGEAVMPLRQVLPLPGGKGAFVVMPAVVGTEALAVKAITVLPGNHGTAYDSHQGAVLLFEAELAARPLRRIRAWSRTPENVEAFADRAARRHGLKVEVARTAREALAGADLVCTVTSAQEPVVQADWIGPGAHINAVGASVPAARELDSATIARARLFVDRRESAQAEAGDFLIPRAEGRIADGHILGELGEVLEGRIPGRRSPEEVTVFKSLGLAVEDLAAARRVHSRAQATGTGTWVELGGERLPNP